MSIRSNAVQNNPSTTAWCEALYEAQAAALVLYGRALGLDHGEAEDVVQDVFRELLSRGERPERPERYLLRACRNRALNHRRSLWRRIAREFEAHRWFEPSAAESPHERAAMRCLAALPGGQREVIVLKLWHGMTFEEIGGLLDLSPNTAAGRYRYGLQKLRTCLREESTETDHAYSGPLGNAALAMDTPPPVPGA